MVRLQFAPVLALGAALAMASPLAQTAAHTALARTADGHPDLQGVWDFRSATPLERPARHKERAPIPGPRSGDQLVLVEALPAPAR